MARLKPYEKLQRHWQATDAPISTGTQSPSVIDELERKYGIHVPEDFRDYLLESCPIEEHGWGREPVSWWPLNRIRNIPDEWSNGVADSVIARGASQYLFFADYAIWCWAWAIACGDDANRGRVVVIGNEDRFVADSFSEFVDRYIEDPLQLA